MAKMVDMHTTFTHTCTYVNNALFMNGWFQWFAYSCHARIYRCNNGGYAHHVYTHVYLCEQCILYERLVPMVRSTYQRLCICVHTTFTNNLKRTILMFGFMFTFLRSKVSLMQRMRNYNNTNGTYICVCMNVFSVNVLVQFIIR